MSCIVLALNITKILAGILVILLVALGVLIILWVIDVRRADSERKKELKDFEQFDE